MKKLFIIFALLVLPAAIEGNLLPAGSWSAAGNSSAGLRSAVPSELGADSGLPEGLRSAVPSERGSGYGRARVISLNLRTVTATKKDGPFCWDNRKEAIVRMLKSEKADIVGTQEGYLCQIDYVSEHCPEYSRVGVGRDDGALAGEFCAIFYLSSKYELIEDGNFWLSETPEVPSKGWGEKYFRIVTWARFREKASGREMMVFNTHYPLNSEAQVQAMNLLVSRIVEIAGDLPVILCADWNMRLDNPILEPLLGMFNDLRTSFRKPDEQVTYNGFGKKSGDLIDHIFYRGFKAVSYKNLNQNYGIEYISDHYPIRGVFRFGSIR